jgi:hypothetical protein
MAVARSGEQIACQLEHLGLKVGIGWLDLATGNLRS